MEKRKIMIAGIPAIIWGHESDQVFIAVHGNKSNKEDSIIELLATLADKKGYQVISFDLPEHGQRKEEATQCKVQNCIIELKNIFNYALKNYRTISLFGCSLGAYFSLMAYPEIIFKQVIFVSPVVNMLAILDNMMRWFNISEEMLKEKQIISLPIDETLYYDYYSFVKEHPVSKWKSLTAVLYGENDDTVSFADINNFCHQFQGQLTVMKDGEHYFHSETQLAFVKEWLDQRIKE